MIPATAIPAVTPGSCCCHRQFAGAPGGLVLPPVGLSFPSHTAWGYESMLLAGRTLVLLPGAAPACTRLELNSTGRRHTPGQWREGRTSLSPGQHRCGGEGLQGGAFPSACCPAWLLAPALSPHQCSAVSSSRWEGDRGEEWRP